MLTCASLHTRGSRDLKPGCGAQSVLFCKTLSSLLRTSITGDSQFGSWFLYVNLILFILVAAFWVQRLNTVRLPGFGGFGCSASTWYCQCNN